MTHKTYFWGNLGTETPDIAPIKMAFERQSSNMNAKAKRIGCWDCFVSTSLVYPLKNYEVKLYVPRSVLIFYKNKVLRLNDIC